MSESPLLDPKHSPAISPHHHPSSPPTTSHAQPASSNAQLATILADTYKENEQLRREAHTLRRRAEKAEKLVQTFQKIADAASSQSSQSQSSSSQPNGSPNGHISHALQDLPEPVVRIVLELEERTQRAEMAQQEAEARKAMMAENWHQLDKYFAVLELRQSEARAGFDRAVREGSSGSLHFGQLPVPPGVMGPPSNSKRRATTGTPGPAPQSSFPSSMSLPPIPGASAPRMVRARTPSLDSSTAYPPSKRARGNSGEDMMRGVRGAYSESHIESYPSSHNHLRSHHQHSQHARMIHPPETSSSAPHVKYHNRSRSRSSSQSSLDEMIIQASTPFNAGAGARRDQPMNQSVSHVGTYQTHVFAPVVTGAPQKKTKYSGPNPNPPPVQGVQGQGSVVNVNADHAPPQVPYPATNEQGQRICRQCGLPGRYKEGKCVEKWGPGPMGPGTVCDRCRKKMKRVERRGTLENQQLQQQQLQAAHTLGVPIAQQQTQRAIPHHQQGIHRTDTLLNASSASIGGSMPFRTADRNIDRERDERTMENHSNVRTLIGSPGKRPPPSPGPSIAALREDDDERPMDRDQLPTSDVGRGAAAAAASSRSSSRNGRATSARGTPRPTNGHLNVKRSPLGGRSPGHMDVDETDADADADAEAEGEAEVVEEDGEGEEDAEAELLEAVNAAEANSSSSGRKSEGI